MQIYSIFGPNFYINSDTRGFSENLLQNQQEESGTNTLRSSLWDSLMRFVSNIDVNLSPSTQNTGTAADLNDMLFFVDDDLPSTGLSLNDMNQYTTLEVFSSSDNEEEMICNICQNPIADGTVIRKLNGCLHKFHTNCIDTWLMNHNSCPICRSAIRPNLESPVASMENNSPSNTTIPLASIPISIPFPSNNASFRRLSRTSTTPSVMVRAPSSTNEAHTDAVTENHSSTNNQSI